MRKNIFITVFLGLGLSLSSIINAQTVNKTVPLDPAFKTGKLENGITYYIRHNEEPKDRASFYIVQNVGAILEEDKQNGLAHFLEHMAFNGTQNFPGKGIIEYLENYGVAFGRNINAYTSVDETVYNLSNVPLNKEELIDSSLLVLHDWSNYLLLTDEEIDAERGVITEEWRTRRNAGWRMYTKTMQTLYEGSQYAKRDVIGDLDVIQNFEYLTIRDFYKKWYRPDLQAIIVVGDFDVDEMEEKVKSTFKSIPKAVNPAERVYYELPDNKDPRYVLATDKEATNTYINLSFKYDIIEDQNKDLDYLQEMYEQYIFTMMMSERISDRVQKADPPFTYASVSLRELVRTKNAASIYVSYKENNWESSFREICRMVENARDFGFNQSELERAKKSLLRSLENQNNTKAKRSHDRYISEVQKHFLKNEPVPGIEYELNFANEFLPQLTLEDVNKFAEKFFTDDNILITVSGPEKEDAIYPSKEEIIQVMNEVKKEELTKYEDTYTEKELFPNLPKKGKIERVENIEKLDAKLLTLSNGIKVFVKQSDLEKEKISIDVRSWGGSATLEDKDIPNSMLVSNFISSYGISDFSATDLSKQLNGKIVSLRPYISNLSEGFSGSSSPADLEIMFQLLNLYFTNPRFDQEAFDGLIGRYKSLYANRKNDVNQAFRDSTNFILLDRNPRSRTMSVELFDEVDFNGIKSIYKARFENPGDFTFVISGDFDEEKLNDLIEQYIASLKVNKNFEEITDDRFRSPKEDITSHFNMEMETPKSSVFVSLINKTEYSQQNSLYLRVISDLLNKRYLEIIREKEGGTYGVSVYGYITRNIVQELKLIFQFDCDSEKSERLKNLSLIEIDKIVAGEINTTELDEVKKNMLKNLAESKESLRYWHGKLSNYATYSEHTMSVDEYTKFVMSIDKEIIAKKAKEFLTETVKVEVIMSPKAK